MLEERVARLIRTIPDFPKKGVNFKDITPLLADVKLTSLIVDAIAEAGRETDVNIVAGIESRGFYFGPMIAQKLGVPFVAINKRGRFPGNTIGHYSYDLEYGSATIDMNTSHLPDHARVMIHDDLLATGVTAAAAAKLIRDSGNEVAMFAFIGYLEFLDGAEKLMSYSPNIFTLADLQ